MEQFLALCFLHCLFSIHHITHNLCSKKTEKEALKNCVGEIKLKIKWFLNSGLCVNKNKTQICVFNWNDSKFNETIFNNEKICVLKSFRILGLIFDSKLNWYNQTMHAIEKINKAKQALKIILGFFFNKKMIKLSMALFYSRLYYGAKILLSSALSAPLKKTVASFFKNVKNLPKRLDWTLFF